MSLSEGSAGKEHLKGKGGHGTQQAQPVDLTPFSASHVAFSQSGLDFRIWIPQRRYIEGLPMTGPIARPNPVANAP